MFKEELLKPYRQNPDSPAAFLFESIYAFTDAGVAGSRPAVIPDLLGSHDIDMIYGTDGGMNAAGGLTLADNGTASLNTYGQVQGIDLAWSLVKDANSALYLLDTAVPTPSHTSNYSYCLCLGWLTVKMNNATGGISVQALSDTGHGFNYPEVDVETGDRLTVVLQVDQTNDKFTLIVNGIEITGTQIGDPYSGSGNDRPEPNAKFVGRSESWDDYYGWNAPINLLAHGHSVASGQELSVAELTNLCNNPLSILETNQDEIDRYGLKFDTDTQGVEIAGLAGALNVKIKLAGDFPDLSAVWASLFDGRRKAGDDTVQDGWAYLFRAPTSGWGAAVGISNFAVNGVPATLDEATVKATKAGDVISFDSIATGDTVIFGRAWNGEAGVTGLFLAEIQIEDSNGIHVFSFDQTHGTTVESETSNLSATLYGFPDSAGYVQDETGKIAGYEFNGTYQAITNNPFDLSQDWEIEFDVSRKDAAGQFQRVISTPSGLTRIYLDATEYGSRPVLRYQTNGGVNKYIALSANGYADPSNRVRLKVVKSGLLISSFVDGVKYADSIPLEDPNFSENFDRFANGSYDLTYFGKMKFTAAGDTREYDFVSGDEAKIVDNLSGKHALFTGNATSGFVPIVNKYIYEIKADGTRDYSTLSALLSAERNADGRVEARVNGKLAPERPIRNGGFAHGLHIKGVTEDAEVPFTNTCLFYKTPIIVDKMKFSGYKCHGSNITYIDSDILAVDPQGEHANGIRAIRTRIGNLTCTTNIPVYIEDCWMHGRIVQSYGQLRLINCVLSHISPRHLMKDVYGSNVGIESHAVNCYFANNQSTTNWDTVENVTKRVDMSTWFNANDKLTADGRTALGEDTGYLGSKIIAWADDVATVLDGNINIATGSVTMSASGDVIGKIIDGVLSVGIEGITASIQATLGQAISGDLGLSLDGVELDAQGQMGNALAGAVNSNLDSATAVAIATLGNIISSTLSVNLEDLSVNVDGLMGSILIGTGDTTTDNIVLGALATLGNNIVGDSDFNLSDAVANIAATLGAATSGTVSALLDNFSLVSNGGIGSDTVATMNTELDSLSAVINATIGQAITGTLSSTLESLGLAGTVTNGNVIIGNLGSTLEDTTAGIVGQLGNSLLANVSIETDDLVAAVEARLGNPVLGAIEVTLDNIQTDFQAAHGSITGTMNVTLDNGIVTSVGFLGALRASTDDIGLSWVFQSIDIGIQGSLTTNFDINITGNLDL